MSNSKLISNNSFFQTYKCVDGKYLFEKMKEYKTDRKELVAWKICKPTSKYTTI